MCLMLSWKTMKGPNTRFSIPSIYFNSLPARNPRTVYPLWHERAHLSGSHHLREMSMKSTRAPVSGDLCVLLLSAAGCSWFVHACVCCWPGCDTCRGTELFLLPELCWVRVCLSSQQWLEVTWETDLLHCSAKHKHTFLFCNPSSFFPFWLSLTSLICLYWPFCSEENRIKSFYGHRRASGVCF